jgi:NTP pyrophosphatase (non-canonical NTP hydrolase)
METIHSEALAILGPSEAIQKLQEETGELHFAVQRYAQGKGNALSVIKELEDVLFVFLRVEKIGKFQADAQEFDIEQHRKQATEKLMKVIQDKLKMEDLRI